MGYTLKEGHQKQLWSSASNALASTDICFDGKRNLTIAVAQELHFEIQSKLYMRVKVCMCCSLYDKRFFYRHPITSADHINSVFLNAVFPKFYLVHFWIPWPIYNWTETKELVRYNNARLNLFSSWKNQNILFVAFLWRSTILGKGVFKW